MDVGVDLYAALLPARLRMMAHTLEYEVGEERDGCGIDDLKPVKPLRGLALAAVRGKLVLVGGIQVPVGLLEDAFRPAGVGVGERTAAGHHAYAKM